MIFSVFAAGLLLAPATNAFWRLPCQQPVLDARVDPIIDPGGPSGHVHTIMGSNAIGYNTNFQDLQNSQCTTCQVTADKSAYWIPHLYYQYGNGSFQTVSHGGMLVYYLQRNAPSEIVKPFPDGLRIFTGDAAVRNYTGTPESQAISWLCVDFNNPGAQQTSGFTNTNCPDGLRAQVFFPACWDGVNLDSPDHKSHMAYPAQIDDGLCPPTHPVHLVSLFYEVWFSVAPFNGLNDGGRFVLANGDPTGYGLHGDFMDGWDKNVLAQAVESCTDSSGDINACGVFTGGNLLASDDQMAACYAPNPLPNEPIDNVVVPYLPGCVAVTNGPGPANFAVPAPGCQPSRRSEPDIPRWHRARRGSFLSI
ncbi:hypothetical protein BJV74DRAFT_780833 [Russula compacta]|nr:hypothetical protein BJV74DRAFT_780833 [Russula compacta]